MRAWLERRGGTLNDFVFPSRKNYMAHMSTRQYARLVPSGWSASAFQLRITVRTRSGARKHRLFTRRLATSAPFKSFSAMSRSTARCATWALTWRTLWNWPNALRSERTHKRPFNALPGFPNFRRSLILARRTLVRAAMPSECKRWDKTVVLVRMVTRPVLPGADIDAFGTPGLVQRAELGYDEAFLPRHRTGDRCFLPGSRSSVRCGGLKMVHMTMSPSDTF